MKITEGLGQIQIFGMIWWIILQGQYSGTDIIYQVHFQRFVFKKIILFAKNLFLFAVLIK